MNIRGKGTPLPSANVFDIRIVLYALPVAWKVFENDQQGGFIEVKRICLHDLDQGWANYGPPRNFLRPANTFSELARVFVKISILGFAFSLQRLCVVDDPIKENVTFTS